MVFKGAGGRSAREISEAIEDVGGDLNASTERDGTSFTASLMAEHLPLGVELHRRPGPPAAFRRRSTSSARRRSCCRSWREARDTPGDIVFDELWSAAFGGQPLGRSMLGDEASIAADRTPATCTIGATTQYRAGNLILVGAGKVEHDALVALAEAALRGDLQPGRPTAAEPARFTGGMPHRPRAERAGAHLTIGMAGAAATRAGRSMPRNCSPTSSAAGASSRLFQELREERGLAYSVCCERFSRFADTGLFYAYAATDRAQCGATLRELIERDARATPPPTLDRSASSSGRGRRPRRGC